MQPEDLPALEPDYPLWTKVLNKKSSPEAQWTCKTCNKSVLIHPNYTEAGIMPCAGLGRCHPMEDIVKEMVRFRRWTLIEFKAQENNKRAVVHFKCNKGHIDHLEYIALRTGSNCQQCSKLAITANANKLRSRDKLVRVECACIGSQGRKSLKPRVCPHHNHKVCFPESALGWDDEQNNCKPEDVPPCALTEYYWICSNDWCNMSYPQSANVRSKGHGCPYCHGRKVCEWNCLKTNFPELADELLPGSIDPTTVVPGSDTVVQWVCRKHPEFPAGFIYPTRINSRTVWEQGCPRCCRGGELTLDGHKAFIRQAREIHGNKYEYPDLYKGIRMPITIICSAVSKGENPTVHGSFMQSPENHKRSIIACPICAQEETQSQIIKALEVSLEQLGYVKKVTYFREAPFDGLRYINPLYTDAYVPPENTVFEIDGGYHFSVDIGRGGIAALKTNMSRDLCKDVYFVKRGMNFIRIPYTIISTPALIAHIINMCRSHKQVYATYQHYYNEIVKVCNLSNVFVIIVPCPKLRL